MDYPELSGATISERNKAFAQEFANFVNDNMCSPDQTGRELTRAHRYLQQQMFKVFLGFMTQLAYNCLLYTSPSPRDRTRSRMPSSA